MSGLCKLLSSQHFGKSLEWNTHTHYKPRKRLKKHTGWYNPSIVNMNVWRFSSIRSSASWHFCAPFWPLVMASGRCTRAPFSQRSSLVNRALMSVFQSSSPSGPTSLSSTHWCPFPSMSGLFFLAHTTTTTSSLESDFITVMPLCWCQCGDHQTGEQLLHQLGQEDVLPKERHSCPGEDHHAQWGTGPDQVHLQWQDRHPDAEHHDLQQVLHQWESLRWAVLSTWKLALNWLAVWLWPVFLCDSGEVLDFSGQRVEITEVRGASWGPNLYVQERFIFQVKVLFHSLCRRLRKWTSPGTNWLIQSSSSMITVWWRR